MILIKKKKLEIALYWATSCGGCARAFNMTQEERIADSDKTAVMNLEEELRKQMRRKSWYDIVAEYVSRCSDISKLVDEWIKKRVYVRKRVEESTNRMKIK